MAAREEYTNCMVPYMRGGGPDRKLRFCTGAKVCSGKAATEEEARQICISEPPKEPKARKTKKKGDCGKEMAQVATCVVPFISAEDKLTLPRLTEILQQCACGKIEKSSREKFIKRCFKENSSTGNLQIDIKEAQKLRSLCTAKYKEQEAK